MMDTLPEFEKPDWFENSPIQKLKVYRMFNILFRQNTRLPPFEELFNYYLDHFNMLNDSRYYEGAGIHFEAIDTYAQRFIPPKKYKFFVKVMKAFDREYMDFKAKIQKQEMTNQPNNEKAESDDEFEKSQLEQYDKLYPVPNQQQETELATGET